MFDKLVFTLPGVRALLGGVAALTALAGAATIGFSWMLATALARLWEGGAVADQLPYLAGFAALLLAHRCLVVAVNAAAARFARDSAARLRSELLARVFDEGPRLVQERGTAAVTASAVEGADEIETYLRLVVPRMCALVIVPLEILVFVFPHDWVTGVIALVAFPFIMLYMVLLGATAKAEAERRLAQFDELANHVVDSMRGASTLRLFGRVSARATSIFAASERFRELTMKTLRTATLSGAVLDLFATGSLAAVAVMLGFRLVDGDLSLFPALLVLVIVPEYFRPVREFAADYHATLDGKNALAAALALARFPLRPTGEAPIAPWSEGSVLELSGVGVSHEGYPALRDASFTMRGFARIGIVGASGAGKSTLASVIGGFTDPDAGRLRLNGAELSSLRERDWLSQVIYIPQSPYIFHASLRDNIAFYRPDASDEDIARAVESAGLASLVESLPEGLATLVGEGERALSGGEAQRVAIARALVDRTRKVIVFDEPTAHLDVETEYELKERMLPLMEGRLVVFATHRLHWLADMDEVVVLDEGRVVGVGRPDEVDLSTIADGRLGQGAADDRRPVETASPAASSVSVPENDSESERRAPNGERGGEAQLRAGAALQSELGSQPTSEAATEPAVAPRSAWKRWVAPYVSRYARTLAAALALGIASLAFAAALMFTSGYLISASAEVETILALHLPLIFVRIFGIGKPLLRYLELLASHDWVLRMTSSMRLELYRAVSVKGFAARAAQRTGDVLGLLADDIGHLQNLYLRCVFPSVVAWVLYAALVIATGWMSANLALAMLLAVGIIVIALPIVSITVNGTRQTRRKRLRAELYADLTDNVLGVGDWMHAGRAGDYRSHLDEKTAELRRIEERMDRFANLRLVLIEAAFAAALVAMIAWAGESFGGSQGGTASWIAAFTLGLIPLIDAFAPVSEAAEETYAHRDSLKRLAALHDPGNADLGEGEDGDGGAKIKEGEGRDDEAGEREAPAAAGAGCDIELSELRFSYPGSTSPVIDGLSLRIASGEKLALLGRSGAGKSTLAALVRGDLEPQSGRILVAGAPAASYGSKIVGRVGVVEQNPYVFRDTLLANLRIGRADATEQEALAALSAVGLGERVAALPEGLSTVIGEGGFGFSGGEAHRIALARVLLQQAPIVILDEPFAGLDPATEQALIDVFFKALADRTVIMITHHLAGADRADRVVILDKGCVKRDGSLPLDGNPKRLERESPFYRRLLAFDRGVAPAR